MYILGVNPSWHDSSAALLKDGQLVVLVEQDRLSRVKHAMGETPARSIAACLSTAGILLDDVEVVALGWDEPICIAKNGEQYDPIRYRQSLLPPDIFGHSETPPFQFVSHHLAHAASGMWTSGFERAAVLVIDGRGETQATSLGVASHAGIEWLDEWDISQSLGNYYGYAAEWVGFTFWGPGKLMGLASYGRPQRTQYLIPTVAGYHFKGSGRPGFSVRDQERQHIALMWDHFKGLYPFGKGDSQDVMKHADFAASIQRALEDAVFQLSRVAKERTGADALVITGGVGLNCTLNGKLAQAGIFVDIYVPPVTFDAGVSLGAAIVADRERCPDRRPMVRFDHAYWGVVAARAEVDTAVQNSGLHSQHLPEDELISRVVEHLSKGRIVAWFQGRAEIGQRALGARSILSDPRDRRQLARLNTVKGREVWRPLAPSVLEEYSGDFFEGELPRLTDFMLAALPVRVDARAVIPAAVHVDGSARPQVVRRATNPRYWRLIDAFRRRTGVPAIINTSFNLGGEPIVHSPEDAILSFCRSEIDVLALDDHLIEKTV